MKQIFKIYCFYAVATLVWSVTVTLLEIITNIKKSNIINPDYTTDVRFDYLICFNSIDSTSMF